MLPESSAKKKPKLTAVLTINNSDILAEGTPLTSVKKILESDNMVIPELNQWLEKRRVTTQHNDKFTDYKKFSGDITIQADKKIQFRLIKKIMYTCGQQQYNNFYLAVLKRKE